MDDGAKALLDLCASIESMDGKAKQLARLMTKLVAVNRINVCNFDAYAEPIRLGLIWGFVDAAAQLNDLTFPDLAPALPIMFGKLRQELGVCVDYDSTELAVELAARREPIFGLARDAAGEAAWIGLPAAFDEDKNTPGLAYRIFQHALRQVSEKDRSVPAPEIPAASDCWERIHKVMRE